MLVKNVLLFFFWLFFVGSNCFDHTEKGAKKSLWNIVKSAKDNGVAVLLSSHCMDDCEALCDRLAIMANGRMRCLDTIAHLKEAHGECLKLVIKCMRNADNNDDQDDQDDQDEKDVNQERKRPNRFVMSNVDGAVLCGKKQSISFLLTLLHGLLIKVFLLDQEQQQDTLVYKIQADTSLPVCNRRPSASLSRIFAQVDEHKRAGLIESYHLMHTSLEQVFMSFACSHNASNTLGGSALLNSAHTSSSSSSSSSKHAFLNKMFPSLVSHQWKMGEVSKSLSTLADADISSSSSGSRSSPAGPCPKNIVLVAYHPNKHMY